MNTHPLTYARSRRVWRPDAPSLLYESTVTCRRAFSFLPAVLALTACASASRPVPPREATLADSGRAAISLEVPTRRPPRRGPATIYGGFWEAVANLDLEAASRTTSGPAHDRFVIAMGNVMDGDFIRAEAGFTELHAGDDDPSVKAAARVMLTATLQHQGKWSELARLPPDATATGALAEEVPDKAAVDAWASAFAALPRRALTLPRTPSVLPLTLTSVGTPTIPVSVNGRTYHFWLDTGSSLTILSSEVALAVGARTLSTDTLAIATAAGRVPALPGSGHSIDIGEVKLRSVNVLIVPAALMEIRGARSASGTGTIRIDGIIGWDTIRELDVRIDYFNAQVTLRAPERKPRSRASRTLVWAGVPLVRMRGPLGTPVNFALDTGAQESFATQWLLEKVIAPVVETERHRASGIGEGRAETVRMIPSLKLTLPGTSVVFRRLLVIAPAFWTFVHLDGVLGSDVARSGVMRIDATGGIFSLGN